MPLSDDEPICPKFQPNIFDPSRCHDCLRQRRLHVGTGEGAEVPPQQKPTAEPEVRSASSPSGKGLALTPIQSQAEDRDTSCKEDSDGQSVISSYCDTNGGRLGFEESSLCILSPDCELYICDGDDDTSTDSCRDYQDFNTEEDYLPIRWRSNKLNMTRLDPPPHRPHTRAWMDDARSQDGFSRRSGLKEDRDRRESGYFSLGRAAGVRSVRDSSPPGPFRHFEKGHPIFNNRSIEPKDTIPFRNPILGVASHRQIPEAFDDELLMEIHPPDPYEVAVEVEAQVGPRSPSPTPFKQAESLVSRSQKVVGNSFNRGSPTSHLSSHKQSGRFEFSRPGSALQSRSSSPSRGSLVPFRRTESSISLSRRDIDSRGWSQGASGGYKGTPQGTSGRRGVSGTLPRNFKSSTGSVKTQSNTVSDFRGALRKTELNRSTNERSEIRNSSPPRRDYNSYGQMSLKKSEVTRSISRGSNSRNSSPPRRSSDNLRDSRSSSQTRKTFASSCRSFLHKSESLLSLNERGHQGRCGSPIREGYDIESQALMRCQSGSNGLDDQEHEVVNISSPRQGFETSGRPVVRKTETKSHGSTQGRESRSSSPGKRRSETPSHHSLGNLNSGGSLRDRSKTSSPPRKNYEAPTQSVLHKSELCCSTRGHDNYNSLALRKSHDPSRKSETSSFPNCNNQSSRNSSPSRRGISESAGYSVLRSSPNREFHQSNQRKNVESNMKSSSCRSWKESTYSLRSSSISHAATTSRQVTNGRTALVTLKAPRGSESLESRTEKKSHFDRFSSPEDKRSSQRTRSPSPSPQIQIQQYTSSQSSMESSESGQLSGASTGRSRGEYATMADLPNVKRVHQRDGTSHAGRMQNQQTGRRQELFKPASHSLSKHPSREWEDAGDTERERHYAGSGYLSRAHSSTSLQRSGSPTADEGHSRKGNDHRIVRMQVSHC
ncbi:serine/arginine repetitive matrix protein 2 [Gouania willdenowi]|uniref:serine/arginine repetitive matrix protein 2 n=1 Tax=Gouania willdenowi TaxID=441366 RepID=UPI0010541957|nr:serine/arginine repetitive matrix protein 2-like [Gouania willdenowi]